MLRQMMIGVAVAAMPLAMAQADTSATANTAVAADPEAETIICKKRLETGSLVRKAKECHTKAEWEKIVESQVRGTRRMAQELQGGMQCDPSFQPC